MKDQKQNPPQKENPIVLEDLMPITDVRGGQAPRRTLFGLLLPAPEPAAEDSASLPRQKRKR